MSSKTQTTQFALDDALSDLQDFVDLGIKFVPSVPSPAMIEAGARAGNITPAQALKIYRAMVETDALGDIDPKAKPN